MAWRYIAHGFRTDCFKLLSAFQASDCHTYKRFTEIWREMKFSYIYYDRKSFCELLEFTEEVFTVCKEFLHPQNSLPFQIGSVYLMYGLYLKQPTRNHVKIRFTLSEWNLLNNLWNITLSVNDVAVPLIISRMLLMNAFQFCFTERQMGLEKKFRKYYEGGEKSTGEMLPSPVTPVMEQLDIQALENVCDVFYQYEEARYSLNRLTSSCPYVNFKKHFSTDIISNLKSLALERIEKENREINRFWKLNGPTDSEDSTEEMSEDEETGVPWWQCKKKMPWWKRCLPFGWKQTEKNKKRGKGNSTDNSSELSLEEDVDDPDIIDLLDKDSMHSAESNSTESENFSRDLPLLPSKDADHLLTPKNTRKTSKGRRNYSIIRKNKGKKSPTISTVTTDNSLIPLVGDNNITVSTNLTSSASKRKTCKGKRSYSINRKNKGKKSPTISAVTTVNSLIPAVSDNNIDVSTNLTSSVSKRKTSKGKSTHTINRKNKGKKSPTISAVTTDNSLIPAVGDDNIAVSTNLTSSATKRKTSKVKSTYSINRKNKGKKSPTISAVTTDNSLIPSVSDDNIAVSTNLTSSASGRKTSKGKSTHTLNKKNKGKKSPTISAVTTDNSLIPAVGDDNIAVSTNLTSSATKRKTSKEKSTYSINRKNKGKKSPTISAVTTDNSLIPSVSDDNIAVSTNLTSSASGRKTSKGKSTHTINKGKKSLTISAVTTDNSLILAVADDNIAVSTNLTSSASGRKTSKGKSTHTINRKNKGKKAPTISAVTTDNSLIPAVVDGNIAVSTNLTTSASKRKTSKGKSTNTINRKNKGKKSPTVSKVTTDISLIPLVGDDNIDVLTNLTSSASERKTSKGKITYSINRKNKGKKSPTISAVTTDNSLIPSVGDDNIAVSTNLTSSASKSDNNSYSDLHAAGSGFKLPAPTCNMRKPSKGKSTYSINRKNKGMKSPTISAVTTDNSLIPSVGDNNIAVTTNLTSSVSERKTSKGKSTYTINRKNKAKKSPTINAVTIDNSFISSVGDNNIAVSTNLTSSANKRKTSKGRSTYTINRKNKGKKSLTISAVTTENSLIPSVFDDNIAVSTKLTSSASKRKTSKGRSTYTINRKNKEKKSPTISTVTTDYYLIPSVGDDNIAVSTNLTSSASKRKTSKGRSTTINRKNKGKKSPTISTVTTDYYLLPSVGDDNIAVSTNLISSASRRKTSKGRSTYTINIKNKGKMSPTISAVTTENYLIPSVFDNNIAVSTNLASSGSKRKTSKGSSTYTINRKKKGKKSPTISTVTTDYYLIPSVGDDNIAVSTNLTSSASKRKTSKGRSTYTINRKNKGKKSPTISAVTTDNSLIPLVGNDNVVVSTNLTSSASKRKLNKQKKSATRKKIKIDTMTYTSSEGKENVSIPNHPSSPAIKRGISKRKKPSNVVNIATHIPSVSSEGEMEIMVPSHSTSARKTRKASKGKSTYSINRNNKEKKSPTIRPVTTDNSLIPAMGDNNIAVSTNLTSSVCKRKLSKEKKSAKTKKIKIDTMTYTSSEGKEIVSIPNYPLSPGN